VLILVIALPPISSDGAVCDERLRLHRLDLSTKHVADVSREPEIEKPQRVPGRVIDKCML